MFFIETYRRYKEEKYLNPDPTGLHKVFGKVKKTIANYKDKSPNYLKLTPELTPKAYAERKAWIKAKWERRVDMASLVVLGFALGVVFTLVLAFYYAPHMPAIDINELLMK